MKINLTKKQIKTIEEKTYFGVNEYDDYYSFNWYTDAGEDFSFDVKKGIRKDIIDDIKDYSFYFDAEEHASSWYGANRGEPTSLRALLDDADKIAEQLDKLSDVVSNFDY